MSEPFTTAAADIRYREIFESAPVGIYASRPDGTLVWCNPAFARILGFDSVAEAMSTNMATVYDSPEHRSAWITVMREREHADQIVVRLRRHDGRFVRVLTSVAGVFDPAGSLIELRGFIMDVTESAEREDALKERELQFRSVFLGAADAMLILDDSRGVVDANRAAAALFGAPIDALIGRTLDQLLVNDQGQLEHAWRELLALGEAKRDHRVLSPAHEVRIVECSYRAAVQTGRHLCIARDITDRQLLEERLMQSEKVESVGRLAGGIAHDFNNLLTAILGYTELLLGTRGPDDPDRADLEEIQKAGQRAAALTQQLLAYSRKQMLSPKEVDLNQTVVGLQSMLTRLIREGITLSYELAPQPALQAPCATTKVAIALPFFTRLHLPHGRYTAPHNFT